MEETILVPSPNWFLASILRAAKDGWVVYGGPAKILVVLEPLSSAYGGAIDSKHRYKAHVISKTHKERVVSVDISPDWPEKRHFLSGSHDGVVKEWALVQVDSTWTIKNIHSHEVHANEKEELVSVGYSMGTHAVSIGTFSNLVTWELNTNVTMKHKQFLKNFKATCMSCSPHAALVVAVGTKQGVVFVLDLKDSGKILYKVRGQDDEISQVSWCPQYEVLLKRALNEIVKKSLVTQRLEQIRNIQEPASLEASGTVKNLPDDSFDEASSVVQEDDMFDIYKDHEADEFGHKKYQPEDIVVKIKSDSKQDNFLAECERLKAQILKNKNEEEETIESLVEAMDKAHVAESDSTNDAEVEVKASTSKAITGVASVGDSGSNQAALDASAHIHKHLLASIGRQGSVRIWSKSGKIVASCMIHAPLVKNKQSQHSARGPQHPSICWYKPDTLLIADGRFQVLECNPLKIDCRNKLECHIVHSSHRRGVYFIASNAPRVQTEEMLADPNCEDDWNIWTIGQDRFLIKYDMKTRAVLAKIGSCGGFLYDVRPCPYDAGKLAIGVGDGAVRVWETHTSDDADNKLLPGDLYSYWHNVQGKILQCAWHPTKENLIAFSTAESRVGLIDTSNKSEKAAKVLQPGLSCGVYSIAWGENMTLFAVGGHELVMYQANKPDDAPIPIRIEIEGQKWDPSCVNYSQHGLMVGSNVGGVAIFSGPGGQALAAKFVFTKMIHTIEWHPLQISSSDEESKYKNLVAICSLDKTNAIVVLEYENKDDGGKQLSSFKTLTGHTNSVLQLSWSPHYDGQLLSTCQDATIRVWDVINGVCTSIYDGHTTTSLSAAWCPLPQLAGKVISGGSDSCLRLWDIDEYPADDYKEVPKEKTRKKKSKGKYRKKVLVRTEEERNDSDNENEEETEEHLSEEEKEKTEADVGAGQHVADSLIRWRASKRYLLPILSRQMSRINLNRLRPVLLECYEKNKQMKSILELINAEDANMNEVDFLKLFGSINEVNEVLDKECESHLTQKMFDGYMMLMIFRGRIDSVIQFANEHDMIDSFLLSMAPCVSFKYWKDVTQLYVAQIDRLVAKKQDDKLNESKFYGGAYYRKAAALLAVHDVKAAVDLLVTGKLFKEAYILCRCRHMDSIAQETLSKWAQDAAYTGNLMLGALINLALGNVSNAANILRRSNEEQCLNLAAELAKSAGLNTFANYMETKARAVEKEPLAEDQTEELLEQLPTRIQLLMKEGVNGELKTELKELEAEKGINGASTSENEVPLSTE